MTSQQWSYSTITGAWHNVVLKLSQRLRRWPSIKTTLVQRLVRNITGRADNLTPAPSPSTPITPPPLCPAPGSSRSKRPNPSYSETGQCHDHKLLSHFQVKRGDPVSARHLGFSSEAVDQVFTVFRGVFIPGRLRLLLSVQCEPWSPFYTHAATGFVPGLCEWLREHHDQTFPDSSTTHKPSRQWVLVTTYTTGIPAN